MNKKTYDIAEKIIKLALPTNARRQLCVLHQIAKSVGKGNSYLMPHLMVVTSHDGIEDETIGKLYAHILDEYDLYPFKSEKNYLKLTYPVDGMDYIYDKFFASPTIVASTTNRYYGVFVIDLSEWKTSRNIHQNKHFIKLMDYVANNKKNITFVFAVDKDFQSMDELEYTLKKKLNVEIFQDLSIEKDDCIDYIVENVEKFGFRVTNGAKQLISINIHECLEREDMNYDILELIVHRIHLKIMLMNEGKSIVAPSVDKAFISKYSQDIFGTTKCNDTRIKIGFVK